MEQKGKGLEAMVRTLVALGIAAHAVSPRLHHALTEVLPVRRSDGWTEADAPMLDLFREQLSRTDVPDPELALWMLNTVAHAVIHRAVVERPEALSQGVLAEELTVLLLRYLRRK